MPEIFSINYQSVKINRIQAPQLIGLYQPPILVLYNQLEPC